MNRPEKLSAEDVLKVQETMNALLAEKDWEQANYLKIMREELEKIYTTFNALASQVYAETSMHLDEKYDSLSFDKSNHQLVYINLYSAEGENLDSWQRIIMNLPKQFITRAIYENEVDAQDAIKLAPVFTNAAYVAIWVEKSSILHVDTLPVQMDKSGHRLINLRDRAVHLNKIEFFWHNMAQYHWVDNGLDFMGTVDGLIVRNEKN